MSSSSSSSSEQLNCDDGVRRIKLVPYYQKLYVANRITSYRLKLVAEAACRMSTAIFRYYRHPLNAQGEIVDEFTGVCSGADMEQLPVDEPNENDVPLVFRSDTCDLVFESQQRAEEALTLILGEITSLKETLDAMDTLEEQPPVWIGGEP